jgi:hypothetical protein
MSQCVELHNSTHSQSHTFKGPKVGSNWPKSTRTCLAMDFEFWILIFDLEFLKGVHSFKALTAKIHLITRAWEVGQYKCFAKSNLNSKNAGTAAGFGDRLWALLCAFFKFHIKLAGRQHYFDIVPTWLKMPWLLLSLLLAYVISPDWKYIVHALNYYTFRKDKQMTDMVQNQRKKDRENFLEK